MRARYNPNAKNEIENCKKYINGKEEIQEILNKEENKKKQVFIEIGMGKGDFISRMSNIDPNNIYIGIEISLPVLALAVKKIKRYEEENNVNLDNLYLMSFDALKLSEYFKKGQITKIYLNFSDPWPKKRHTKRRLTYETFLKEYKFVLKDNGILEFKTDNRSLFEYSLVSMQNFGVYFLEVYLDLHKSDVFNIESEYEKKFSPKGPIYKLIGMFNRKL